MTTNEEFIPTTCILDEDSAKYKDSTYAMLDNAVAATRIDMTAVGENFDENVVKLCRRSAITELRGNACGPIVMVSIDAEIEVEKAGERVFLSAQWSDADEECLCFSATNESLFEFLTDPLVSDESIQELERIQEKKVNFDVEDFFPDQCEDLVEMVNERLLEIGHRQI